MTISNNNDSPIIKVTVVEGTSPQTIAVNVMQGNSAHALTADVALLAQTASLVNFVTSASYAGTASFALNAGGASPFISASGVYISQSTAPYALFISQSGNSYLSNVTSSNALISGSVTVTTKTVSATDAISMTKIGVMASNGNVRIDNNSIDFAQGIGAGFLIGKRAIFKYDSFNPSGFYLKSYGTLDQIEWAEYVINVNNIAVTDFYGTRQTVVGRDNFTASTAYAHYSHYDFGVNSIVTSLYGNRVFLGLGASSTASVIYGNWNQIYLGGKATTVYGQYIDFGTIVNTGLEQITNYYGLYLDRSLKQFAPTGDNYAIFISGSQNSILSNITASSAKFDNNVTVVSPSINSTPLTIRGFTTQSASLTDWRNTAGAFVASISPVGDITASGNLIVCGSNGVGQITLGNVNQTLATITATSNYVSFGNVAGIIAGQIRAAAGTGLTFTDNGAISTIIISSSTNPIMGIGTLTPLPNPAFNRGLDISGSLRLFSAGGNAALILGSGQAGYVYRLQATNEVLSLSGDAVNSSPTWLTTIFNIRKLAATPASNSIELLTATTILGQTTQSVGLTVYGSTSQSVNVLETRVTGSTKFTVDVQGNLQTSGAINVGAGVGGSGTITFGDQPGAGGYMQGGSGNLTFGNWNSIVVPSQIRAAAGVVLATTGGAQIAIFSGSQALIGTGTTINTGTTRGLDISGSIRVQDSASLTAPIRITAATASTAPAMSVLDIYQPNLGTNPSLRLQHFPSSGAEFDLLFSGVATAHLGANAIIASAGTMIKILGTGTNGYLAFGSSTAGFVHRLVSNNEIWTLSGDIANSGPTWPTTVWNINTSLSQPISRSIDLVLGTTILAHSTQSVNLRLYSDPSQSADITQWISSGSIIAYMSSSRGTSTTQYGGVMNVTGSLATTATSVGAGYMINGRYMMNMTTFQDMQIGPNINSIAIGPSNANITLGPQVSQVAWNGTVLSVRSPANVGLSIVNGAQQGNTMQWRMDATSSLLLGYAGNFSVGNNLNPTAQFVMNVSGTMQMSGSLILVAGANPVTSSTVPFAIYGQTVQAGNLTEWRTASGSVSASVSASGDLVMNNTGSCVIMRSPNGTRFKVFVLDNGTLSSSVMP
jgi:hypothetical protein